MNRSKAETALARRVVQGETDAWEQLVRTHFPRVHSIHALATGDEEAAASLAEATFQEASRDISGFLRDDEPFAHWITSLSREVAHRFLSEDDWRATPWAQGQELLTDPPLAEPLDREALHGEDEVRPEPLERSLAELSLGHRLLSRLVFQEGIPSGRLAGILSASSMFVRSFTYGLLDQLGSLETLEHGREDCEPGLTLALRALEQRHDQRALKDLLAQNAGCEGCQTLVFRVLRLADGLGDRGESEAAVPEDALARLALLVAPRSPGTAPPEPSPDKPPPARVIPLRAKPQVRNQRQRVAHWAFAAAILLFFLGGTVTFLREGPPPRPAEGSTLGGEEPAPATGRSERAVAYYEGRSGRKHLLQAGQPLHASPLGASSLSYLNGARALLTASSAMTGEEAGLSLTRGRVLVHLDGMKSGDFRVRAARALLTAGEGDLAVSTAPGSGAVFAIKGGSAEVRLPDGSRVTLDPFRQLRVAADGSYRIEDTGTGSFSEAGSPDLPGAAGSAGGDATVAGSGSSSAASRSTLLGRYAPRGGGRAGGSTGYGSGRRASGGGDGPAQPGGGHGDPPDNGVMTPGDRPRPGTVRGFRDAF